MLFPLTIALFIVSGTAFTVYVFRLAIARRLGRGYRQLKQDEVEVRREYENGKRG